MRGPVAIADDVFWVGHTLDGDAFQLHAYLIRHGRDSVLIDPGSIITIEQTLTKVREVVDLDDIRWIVCHHPDPDVAGALTTLSTVLTRTDVELVTEWRGQALLKHYDHRFPAYRVEEHDWRLALGPERELQFQLTPYLHFPGAFVTFDTASRTLFSSDIFGGFVDDERVLTSDDPMRVVRAVTPFHQHYMPTGALLRSGLQRIQQRWPDIARVAPQHGYVFEGSAVEPTFTALEGLECGLFAQDGTDHELGRFLQIAEARAELQRSLQRSSGLHAWQGALNAIVARSGLAESCDLAVFVPDSGWHRWGWSADGVPCPYPTGPDVIHLPGQPLAALLLTGVDHTRRATAEHDLLLELQDVLRPLIDALVRQHVHVETVHHLRTASETDELTGSFNRRALYDHPPTGGYAMLAIDIDRFKGVNDSLGHPAGDALIIDVAAAIRACVRQSDNVYRVGGDEFVVVLPNANEDRALEVAERCRRAVAALHATDSGPQVTLSIGVTAVPPIPPTLLQDAIASADAALYQAKRGGRNRVAVAWPVQDRPRATRQEP